MKFDPEDQDITLQNIILAGGGSQIKGLGPMLVEKLKGYGKVEVTTVDDPIYIGCSGALKLATEIPVQTWSQIGVMFAAES